MIDYLNSIREMIMTCDLCEDESTFYGTWQSCVSEAKDEGWKMNRDDCNVWTHKCPACALGGGHHRQNLKDIFPPTTEGL